jgi:hypothetical protein
MKTMIRPVVTASPDTWTSTAKDEKSYAFLKGKARYLVLSILTMYGEYEIT